MPLSDWSSGHRVPLFKGLRTTSVRWLVTSEGHGDVILTTSPGDQNMAVLGAEAYGLRVAPVLKEGGWGS